MATVASRPALNPAIDHHAASSTRVGGRWWTAGLVALAGAAVLGLSVGAVAIPPWRVAIELVDRLPLISADSGLSETERTIVWDLRAPRVVLGLLVGALLSGSGAAYQGVFRNPLADPYLLGIAAGAGLGATLAIVSGLGDGTGVFDPVPMAAFAGGLIAVAASITISRRSGDRSTATLVLAGVAVANFLTAVQTYVQQRHQDSLRQVFSWILGRLTTSGWGEVTVVLPYAVVCLTTLVLLAGSVDVLGVGDDEAASLGLRPGRRRAVVVVVASLAAAAAVAVSGLIGFVGLVVPHGVRLVAGSSYRRVLPLSMLFGGRVPGPGRHRGPHDRLPRRAADRCHHCGSRRAVLRRAALPTEGGVTMLRDASERGVRAVSPPSAASLEWRRVSVELGGRAVLDRIDLRVPAGCWTAVVGPNGSGKTTLLRALLGAVRHTGTVSIGAADRSDIAARDLARRIAVVPQHPTFPPGIRVRDYVMLGRTPHQGMLLASGAADRAAVSEALDRLDLGGLAARRVEDLSGGERQRAVLARALAQDTPILVLDEPTTHLDLGHQADLLELIAGLHEESGLTVVTTLHDLSSAGQYADRIAILHRGRLVAEGLPPATLTAEVIAEHWGVGAEVAVDGQRVTVTVRRRRPA